LLQFLPPQLAVELRIEGLGGDLENRAAVFLSMMRSMGVKKSSWREEWMTQVSRSLIGMDRPTESM
jgi:hypothetical protein